MINYEACRVKEIIERDYHKMRDKKLADVLMDGFVGGDGHQTNGTDGGTTVGLR